MPRAKTPRNGNAAKNVTPINKRMPKPAKSDSGTVNLDEEIRVRAYEIYQQRGNQPGSEHEDWLLAEREVLARHNQQTA
jgi:Protein of unknown function (DUF2934)